MRSAIWLTALWSAAVAAGVLQSAFADAVPWSGQDIGAVLAAGSHSENGTTLTVLGSGDNFWGNVDDFHFVFQPLTGDGEVVAQLASLASTNPYGKAALMMRESTAANARFAALLFAPGAGGAFHYRTTTGGAAGPGNSFLAASIPRWLRLVRQGNLVSGYFSSDGVGWTLRGSVTLNLPATIQVGLAVTSHADGSLATAVFSNVAITAVTPPPPPVPDLTPPSTPASLIAAAIGSGSISLSWLPATDTGGSGLSGYRIYRDGSPTPVANISATTYTDNGLTLNTSYSYQVTAVDGAGNESGFSTAAAATTLLASAWSGQDIGAVLAAGSHSENGTTLTVLGSGDNFWGNVDDFHFVFQPLTGDGEVVAQLASLASTNPYGKAALMMRESTAANARFAALLFAPGAGGAFHYRTTTGGAAGPGNSFLAASIPRWLRLVRQGNLVSGYFSSDGVGWTLRGSVTLNLPATIQVGLAVTSHADGSLATAVFSNVAFSPKDLQPGHWAAVSLNTLRDVNPCPANNCSYSASEGQSAVIDDWNGGAFAAGFGTHGGLIVWGGGHQGYYGNEVYIFNLDTWRWQRLSEPVANPVCNQTTGELQDGSPCSPHTHEYVDYHPATNSFVSLGSTSNHDFGGGGSPRVHLFDLGTRRWRAGAENLANFYTNTGASSAYDPNRDVFWLLRPYYRPFAQYDPNANGGAGTWRQYSPFNIELDGVSAIDPTRDLFVTVDARGGQRVSVHDLANPSAVGIDVTTSGDLTLQTEGRAAGFEWDPVSLKFVGWMGGTDVFTLTPASGDWKTGTWVWERVPAAANNTVAPTAPNPNGTYGRWRYVPSVNAFIVVNDVNDPVFMYKLGPGSGATVP